MQKYCQKAFVHVLHSYCHGKSYHDIFAEGSVKKFLIDLINLTCNCMPYKHFVIEMGLNWIDWIYVCLPLFLNVPMVFEINRNGIRKNINYERNGIEKRTIPVRRWQRNPDVRILLQKNCNLVPNSSQYFAITFHTITSLRYVAVHRIHTQCTTGRKQ